MSITIEALLAREILDSRGIPTVETDILVHGSWFRASVPSGASTGTHEAVELRDGDPRRYGGKGVQKAIRNLTEHVFPAVGKKSWDTPKALDDQVIALDGTENKSRLGANATLALSVAAHRAFASMEKTPLFEYLHDTYFPKIPYVTPTPMMNVINGGKHADTPIRIQEFMICPHLDAQSPVSERVRVGSEIYAALKSLLKKNGLSTTVGDEGGFAPIVSDPRQVLDYLLEAITQAGYQAGKNVSLALDVAANEFFQNGCYSLYPGQNPLAAKDLISEYQRLCAEYPALVSIEDPLAEDAWGDWTACTQSLLGQNSSLIIVGDDLLVTNPKRLSRAISQNCCNAILVKMNQIGSVSETAQTIGQAKEAGFHTIISHRSGETEDPAIAHLAAACGAAWVKMGAPCRTDRTAKYNELLRIFA